MKNKSKSIKAFACALAMLTVSLTSAMGVSAETVDEAIAVDTPIAYTEAEIEVETETETVLTEISEDGYVKTGQVNTKDSNTKFITEELHEESMGEFIECADIAIDPFSEYNEDDMICGEAIDSQKVWVDDLGIALGFDYKFSSEDGVLYINDIYGVVRTIDEARRADNSDKTLYISDNIDLIDTTVRDYFFDEQAIIDSQFMGLNGSLKSIVYTDKAIDVLNSNTLPVGKVFYNLATRIWLRHYDKITFTGNGTDRFSLYENMAAEILSIEIRGTDSNLEFTNGMLINNDTNELITMLPAFEYETSTFTNTANKLYYENCFFIPENVKYLGTEALTGCDFSGVTIVLPNVVDIGLSALDFKVSPDRFIFFDESCRVRTPVGSIPEGLTVEVLSYSNSAVQEWAASNNFKFITLDMKINNSDLDAVVKYGDVNLDGAVTVADCVTINMYNLDSDNVLLTGTARTNADVFKDGEINTSDAALLLNYISMLIEYEVLGADL